MRRRFVSLKMCFLVSLCSCAVALPQEGGDQAKKGPQWKDRAEYTLVSTTYQEKDPAKKLRLLDEWKEKYPETDFAQDRVRVYMATYQQTRQNGKAVEVAKELLEMVPGDFSANVTIASLTIFLGKTDSQTLADGAAAAKTLLGAIDARFQASNKPAQVPVAAWDNARKQIEISSHQTLGWVAMQEKENLEAERRFKKVLELKPISAQVSYWLGQVVLGQANPDKNELAMFSYARAASYDGPNSLPAQSRQQIGDYLREIYEKFAGTEEGLAEMRAIAKTQPLPPPGLEIKSGAQRKFEAEQRHRKENPKLYVFIDLRKTLLGPTGDAIWSDLRNKLTPELKLFVISSTPASRPKTINLSSQRGGSVELVLNLENRQRSAIGAGRKILFEGVAASLTKDPFRLVLNDGKILP